jgi:hypothetical protein
VRYTRISCKVQFAVYGGEVAGRVHGVESVKNNLDRKIRGEAMLWTICVILIVLWLVGMVSSYTMGGLIHILLVIAIIVVLVNVIQGRRG